MSQPVKDQHYLPQSYLKGFADKKKKLLALNMETFIKYKKVPDIKPVTTAQICYGEHFYTIPENTTSYGMGHITNRFHIENEHFVKFENGYQKLVKKMGQQQYLSTADAKNLIGMIIELKFRNKYFREQFVKARQSQVIEEASSEIEKRINEDPQYLQDYPGASKEVLIGLSQEIGAKLLADEQFGKNAHLSAILRTDDAYTEMIGMLTARLLTYSWIVYRCDRGFIANDNPGFSMDSSSTVHNSFFEKDFVFHFPLNSSLCLVISDAQTDLGHILAQDKKHFRKADIQSEHLHSTNLFSLHHFNRTIFGESSASLERIRTALTKILHNT